MVITCKPAPRDGIPNRQLCTVKGSDLSYKGKTHPLLRLEEHSSISDTILCSTRDTALAYAALSKQTAGLFVGGMRHMWAEVNKAASRHNQPITAAGAGILNLAGNIIQGTVHMIKSVPEVGAMLYMHALTDPSNYNQDAAIENASMALLTAFAAMGLRHGVRAVKPGNVKIRPPVQLSMNSSGAGALALQGAGVYSGAAIGAKEGSAVIAAMSNSAMAETVGNGGQLDVTTEELVDGLIMRGNQYYQACARSIRTFIREIKALKLSAEVSEAIIVELESCASELNQLQSGSSTATTQFSAIQRRYYDILDRLVQEAPATFPLAQAMRAEFHHVANRIGVIEPQLALERDFSEFLLDSEMASPGEVTGLYNRPLSLQKEVLADLEPRIQTGQYRHEVLEAANQHYGAMGE